MVRFSCFSTPNLIQKPKKIRQSGCDSPSTSQHKSDDQERNVNSGSSSTKKVISSSQGDFWKSDYINGDSHVEDSKKGLHIARIKKSQSLGCILDNQRGLSDNDEDEDDDVVDRQFSFNYSQEKSTDRFSNFHDGINFDNQKKVNDYVKPFDVVSDNDRHGSLFSIEVVKQFDALSNDFAADSESMSADNHPTLARSKSVSNIRVSSDNSEGDETHNVKHRSRSFQNLCSLNDDDDESDKDRNEIDRNERHDYNNQTTIDRYPSDDDIASANEKREPESDDENLKSRNNGVDPKENKFRHIEEWISQIDIENGSIVPELGESTLPSQETQVEVVTPYIKPEVKNNLGMEVAYNYISSLNATSSSAQMVNLGLVQIPFLSAFSSLRVLNLSGNSIVRITAGSLPKGLHILNLSKNNIAAIEGLRDLTRLRVLDLSYNRIVRIGHGLASCSSIKELYLAGNKISDIEGLHRLLKLNTLELRNNKISTAKGLGQLAANYASLQAINLEGNPAQKNVGDEQLRRYLLSLLPNLVYYNKQVIKAGGAKETSDRSSTRSVTRTEHNKIARRGSHGSGLHKKALNQARSNHAIGSLLKQSRNRSVGNVENRHFHLPPTGSKPANYLPYVEKKLVSLQTNNPIRRSRSVDAI